MSLEYMLVIYLGLLDTYLSKYCVYLRIVTQASRIKVIIVNFIVLLFILIISALLITIAI
jgi:hypothetical protein